MHKPIGWLWIAGFFSLVAAANAQTPSSSAAGIKYDGTYAFVSSTKVNETYMTTGTTRIGRCGGLPPRGPLTIVNGHARYNLQEGTVGSQGELAMRFLAPSPFGRCGGCSPGVEIITRGRIDGNGTVRARRIGYYCSHDLVWQKVSK
jgi:hypothetical protein